MPGSRGEIRSAARVDLFPAQSSGSASRKSLRVRLVRVVGDRRFVHHGHGHRFSSEPALESRRCGGVLFLCLVVRFAVLLLDSPGAKIPTGQGTQSAPCRVDAFARRIVAHSGRLVRVSGLERVGGRPSGSA